MEYLIISIITILSSLALVIWTGNEAVLFAYFSGMGTGMLAVLCGWIIGKVWYGN